MEEEVGLPKGQAGTLAPPSPQDLDRKRPQQRAGFKLFGFILSGLAVYRGFVLAFFIVEVIDGERVFRRSGSGTKVPGYFGLFRY